MSKKSKDQEFVKGYLLSHEEFTNGFVLEWIRTHPDLLKQQQQPMPTLGVPTLSPNPVSIHGGGKLVKHLSKHNYSTANLHFQRKNPAELRKLSKKELFMELLRDVVSPDFDANHLSHKILVNVILLVNADKSSLFLMEGSEDSRVLVSRLFDVTENSTVEEAVHADHEAITIPVGVGIAGQAAQTGTIINIEDAYKDPRFNQAVDKQTGYKTKSILCVPVKAPDGQVMGAAQVINKKDGDGVFTKEDIEIFSLYLTFCAIGLINAQLFEQTILQSKRLEGLLGLARGIFEDTTSLSVMIKKIMLQAQELIPCEMCRVLLVDDNPPGACSTVEFTKAFELASYIHGTSPEMKAISIDNLPNLSTATQVAMTGQPVNVCDGVSQMIGFSKADRTGMTLLCMPIFDKNGQSIGVAQMINKINGLAFTPSDVESFEVFATFCGLGINNVITYENVVKANAKQNVILEMLSYHASAPEEEVQRLWLKNMPSAESINLCSYNFDDLLLSDDATVLAAARIFYDCGFVDRYRINQKVLLRWVLSVRKNYRAVIYHNWRHAFNVAQTMFAMFTSGKMSTLLKPLEMLALLIAAFCHDLDHRGTNNAFQSKSDSPLALLYTTSTMEHHHFDHCIMILNSEANNILQGLTSEEYTQAISVLESAILSTDLALYFQKKGTFANLVSNGTFKWDSESHRDLLRGMMMTACDVSAITKPWEIQKRVAELVASEFFEQGDIEKNDLNLQPIAMMDRQKKDELPKMQVGFIDAICITLYQVLASLHEGFEPLLLGVIANRNNWQRLVDGQQAEAEADTKEKKVQTAEGVEGNLSMTSVTTLDTKEITTETPMTKTPTTDTSTAQPSEADKAMPIKGEEEEEEEAVPSTPISAWGSGGSQPGDGKKKKSKSKGKKLLKAPFKLMKKLLGKSSKRPKRAQTSSV